jgi:outer membrane protein assembly factor BamD
MRKVLVIIVACLLLLSCASKKPKQVENPGNLYVDGVNLMKTKKYDKAIEKFSSIRENFPFDPMAIIAAVKLADVYFEKKEYVLASGMYEEYLKAYPGDENVPYALMKVGDCYEKLSLSVDRDQAYVVKAVERYTYLRNRYPSSSYAQAAEVKLKTMLQKLADRELYIGEFYYKTYRYNAAILRLEYMLKKFPEANGVDRALYCIAMSYKALGENEKSAHYLDRLRREHPRSRLLKSSSRESRTFRLASAATPTYEETQKRDIQLKPVEEPVRQEEKKRDDFSFFDRKKPVDIASDTMEGFEKERFVVFKGSVVARQEDLYIYAETVEAFMGEGNSEIERAHARGNVKVVKQDRTATSNEALFDNRKGEITLKGNVVVYSGLDKLTGDIVTYFVNEDRVQVEGQKERKARITIQPK